MHTYSTTTDWHPSGHVGCGQRYFEHESGAVAAVSHVGLRALGLVIAGKSELVDYEKSDLDTSASTNFTHQQDARARVYEIQVSRSTQFLQLEVSGTPVTGYVTPTALAANGSVCMAPTNGRCLLAIKPRVT